MSSGADLVVGVLSALLLADVVVGVALARIREKVARIEEWQRLHDELAR